MLIIQRTDAETAGYITCAPSPASFVPPLALTRPPHLCRSTIDARDRPFILGSTSASHTDSLVEHIATSATSPGDAEDEWIAAAALSTLDEAVAAACAADVYSAFLAKSAGKTVAQAARVAKEMGIAFFWDCEAARSREGWYRYRGDIDAAIMRSAASAPYADVLWTRYAADLTPSARLRNPR